MPKRNHPVLALTAAVPTATAVAAAGGAPASAELAPKRNLINKMDGSRLALLNNSTAEGATGITLRDPAWKYSTEQWEFDFSAWQADGRSTTPPRPTASPGGVGDAPGLAAHPFVGT